MRLYRYLVPGLVIQAVLVGCGYATGRERVEFFISKGPATRLAGFALTALWISAAAVVGFELARQYRAFDYRSFCRIFLGRFWLLFEMGYYALLLLVLSVLSAAAGKLLAQMLGLPELINSILFISVVAFVVFFGNSLIERVISARRDAQVIAELQQQGDAPALEFLPVHVGVPCHDPIDPA